MNAAIVSEICFKRVNPALGSRAKSEGAGISAMLAAGWVSYKLARSGQPELAQLVRTTIDEATAIAGAPSQELTARVMGAPALYCERLPKLGSCRRQARDRGGRLGNALLKVGRAIAEQAVLTPEGNIHWQPMPTKAWRLVNARTIEAVVLARFVWEEYASEAYATGDRVLEREKAVAAFVEAAKAAIAAEWEIIPVPVEAAAEA